MNMGNILAKAAGATTLYYSLVDINRFGNAFKDKNPQAKIAKYYPELYIQSKQLDINQTYLPTVVSRVKKFWYDTYLKDTIMPFIWSITGYVSGVTTGAIHNAVPMALSVGALALSATDKFDKATGRNLTNYSWIKKNGGKVCLGLLALGAAKTFLYEVCGIGKPKQL